MGNRISDGIESIPKLVFNVCIDLLQEIRMFPLWHLHCIQIVFKEGGVRAGGEDFASTLVKNKKSSFAISEPLQVMSRKIVVLFAGFPFFHNH